jgi:hypothetical protein
VGGNSSQLKFEISTISPIYIFESIVAKLA